MNVEISTEINESVETAALCPTRSIRLVGIAFGICCYLSFAYLYFLRPGKPVVSLGPARFTVDALMELSFTVFMLPFFGMAYLHGIRRHDENPDFAVPDFAIDLLLVAAIAWVAIGNGIHLTAKLDEQMISPLKDERGLGIKTNFHWIRQVVGHVFPHIGWQLLFSALMLGQAQETLSRSGTQSRGLVLWGSFWFIIRPRGHCGRLHTHRVCLDRYLVPRVFLFGTQIEVTAGRNSHPGFLHFQPSHVPADNSSLLAGLPLRLHMIRSDGWKKNMECSPGVSGPVAESLLA